MIIDSQTYTGDGSTRQFASTTTILSNSHVAVFLDNVLQSSDKYDVLGSVLLFDIAPENGVAISFTVSDTGEDLPVIPSQFSRVNQSIENIDTLAGIAESVDTVANISGDVTAVANNNPDVSITANDISNINTVAEYIRNGNTVIGSNGQLLGTSVIKPIAYLANSTSENIRVLSGTNGYSVDSLTLEDGASVTVEDGATYKIL